MVTLGYENFQANSSILSLTPSVTNQNTGTATFLLPPASSFSQGNFQYGKNYRIIVKYMYSGSQISDQSNSTFTINTPTTSSSSCNNNLPVKLIITGLDSNGGPGDPIYKNSQKKALSRLVLYPTCDLIVDKFEIYTTDLFVGRDGFSKYYIHDGYQTDMNGAATGSVIGSLNVNSNNYMGGVVTLDQPLFLSANQPKSITISGDVKGGIISNNTFQVCAFGPGPFLKDANNTLISQLPGNVFPTTILGRMTCGQFLKIQ